MRNSPYLMPALRRLTWAALAVTVAWLAPSAAQDWPSKPIRFIVPVPPGAGPDVDMRQIAQRLGTLLGQPAVVENRPGAAARIATDAVAKAAPDGYTFLVGTPSALVTGPLLYNNLPYDAKRDLAPVSLVSTTHYALTVNAQVPANTVAAYVALVKSNPQYANAGTLGLGTATHLAGEWFANLSQAPLKFIHYNTSTPYNDLMSGQISGVFEAVLPVIGNVKAGRLKVLAITGKQRHPLLPDAPTFAEAGFPTYDPVVWIGVLAPAATPKAVIGKVSAAIAQIARQPEIIAQRRETVSDSVGSTPEEYGAFLDAERAKWGAVIRQANLKIE
jgi:tripartite-type tricarboxylate transporter receptor subunit TctC